MSDTRRTILPATATPLAKALDRLEERLFGLPVQMINKDPYTVDVALLDHLAWEYSVDVWDLDWPEDIKRDVIAASIEVHRFKGTPFAIKRALKAFDVYTEFLEWFEPEAVDLGMKRGSFRVTAYAGRALFDPSSDRINERMVHAMTAVVQRVAPVSRKLEFRLGYTSKQSAFARFAATGRVLIKDAVAPAVPTDPTPISAVARLGFRARMNVRDQVLPSAPARCLPGNCIARLAITGQVIIRDTLAFHPPKGAAYAA